MSVIERWTIYEGIEGTHGIWTERGDHPGWKGKLRGKFRRVVVVPEDQLTGAVKRADYWRETAENILSAGFHYPEEYRQSLQEALDADTTGGQ